MIRIDTTNRGVFTINSRRDAAEYSLHVSISIRYNQGLLLCTLLASSDFLFSVALKMKNVYSLLINREFELFKPTFLL